jgi:putative SOS response-associated peptidase YedK
VCGRYTLTKPDWFEHDFHSIRPTLADAVRRPRFNVAPGQMVLALSRPAGGARVGETMHWGIEANWPGGPPQLINARGEKLAESKFWKPLLENGRCAIPADGFYEWKTAASGSRQKQPIWFQRKSGEPFWFAGLSKPGEDGSACVIITVQPNELVEDVHDRMPAMLAAEQVDEWLTASAEDAVQLLAPFASIEMTATAVSRAVGNAANEGPELVEPVTPESLF